MTIYVDLGTSRAAIGFAGDRDDWLPAPADAVMSHESVRDGTAWAGLQTIIRGAVKAGRAVQRPLPYVVFHSRYCNFDGLVLPIAAEGDDLVLPTGAQVYPPSRSESTFSSLKDDSVLTRNFVDALKTYARALWGQDAEWVMGRSSGARDIRDALPGVITYNEAVAVVYALLAHEQGALLRQANERFVVVADLGGGFLDVSVADSIELGERRGARVVNYGGYPLGVDRVAPRFSTKRIGGGAESLLDLVGLAIRYHIWAYRQESRKNERKRGLVLLTGGGFQRLGTDRRLWKVDDPLVEVRRVADDTKYLTLLGLQTMRTTLARAAEHPGEDITRKAPSEFGGELLDDFAVVMDHASDDVIRSRAMRSWFATLNDLRDKLVK